MRMPKDYFEVEEVQEHVSEEDKQAKVIKSADAIFYRRLRIKLIAAAQGD